MFCCSPSGTRLNSLFVRLGRGGPALAFYEAGRGPRSGGAAVGTGGFGALTLTTGFGTGSRGLELGDVNGDGAIDLVIEGGFV